MRELVRTLTPPVLISLYRNCRQRLGTAGPVWEGIYSGFNEVPTRGGGFDDDAWIRDSLAHALRVRQETVMPGQRDSDLLALVVALLYAGSGGVRILDFGGSVGFGFLALRPLLAAGVRIAYHIIEKEGICAAGSRFFAGEDRVHFHAALPLRNEGFDLVFINTALQYVEDYAGLLGKLAGYHPRHFLFARLAAGQIPTYATGQMNHRGSAIPCWFLNVDEVIGIMNGLGYRLTFREQMGRDLPQANFPTRNRLGRSCNLLFSLS